MQPREHALLRSPRTEAPVSDPIRPLAAQISPIGNQGARRFAEFCPTQLPSPNSCPFGGICHSCPIPVQAKLVIGPPDDEYEKEADRIADEVMRMPDPQAQGACPTCDEDEELVQTKPLADRITPLVQRQVDPEDDEEEILQSKSEDTVQRQTEPEDEEEEIIQTKADNTVQRQEAIHEDEEEEVIQMKPAGTARTVAAPETAASIVSLQGGGRPLTASESTFFEPRFGRDFSDVRIHDSPRASQAASAISARAFTRGADIVFASGQSATGTRTGRQLLAHELTHVVQQRDGRVAQNELRRMLALAFQAYRGECACGHAFGNDCAHFLSDALILGGYSELDGGMGRLNRRHNGRIVCRSGRPVRAKELRDWFASKATDTKRNEPEADIPAGYWAVYQERARDGQGHVLLHHHTGGTYDDRGTGDYPRWRTQVHYRIPSPAGDWDIQGGSVGAA